ncbi:MAG: D-alanine--D-alanine ligase [Chlorobiales bacterium]|nr:D-alanine--D-alanine ligase [Chlorobiales bacterium]
MKKLKVAILFGGRSGEHEISIVSARSVASALDKKKYQFLPIYITKDGHWLSPDISQKVLSTDFEALIKSQSTTEIQKIEHEILKLSKTNRFSFDFKKEKIDVAFPVLHGPFGEDGTIQGLFEMMDVAYVGCGVLSSSLTMDKAMSKICFEKAGLNVADYMVVMRSELGDNLTKILSQAEKRLKFPIFVKPANMGSSVGISKAKNRKELTSALEIAAKYDRKIVLEKGIDARELEVAVLGNENPVASTVGEIVPCNEFYDYDAKYVKGTSELYIPARVSKPLQEKLRKAAIDAFKAVACEGLARVDFFLERKTNRIYINEINTIPGFTSISMYPKLFGASGIDYPSLIDRLIELALERYQDKAKNMV